LPDKLTEQEELPLDVQKERHESNISPNSPDSRQRLSPLLGEISKHAKKLRLLLGAHSDPNPEILSELDQLKQIAGELLSTGYLDAAKTDEESLIKRSLDELPLILRQFTDERGLQLWGALPDFIIDGVVYVGIDFKTNSVTVNDQKLSLFPFSKLLSKLNDEIENYKKEIFKPNLFLEKLVRAFKKAGGTEKNRVAVFKLLSEIALQEQSKSFFKSPVKERFKSYSQHKFRADLFRLLKSETGLTSNSTRLILEPTSVAEEGLFMYLPAIGRCAFVGHVRFDQSR
jgi:hypothetical protein